MLDKRPLLRAGALCAIALSLAACSAGEDKGGRSAPEVGYVTVAVQPVPVTPSLGGRTVAYETSEVGPQVNGLIRRRLFTAGSFVRAGEQRYQTNARLYQAGEDGSGSGRERVCP